MDFDTRINVIQRRAWFCCLNNVLLNIVLLCLHDEVFIFWRLPWSSRVNNILQKIVHILVLAQLISCLCALCRPTQLWWCQRGRNYERLLFTVCIEPVIVILLLMIWIKVLRSSRYSRSFWYRIWFKVMTPFLKLVVYTIDSSIDLSLLLIKFFCHLFMALASFLIIKTN